MAQIDTKSTEPELESEQTIFRVLDDDLLGEIFSYLPLKSNRRINLICKELRGRMLRLVRRDRIAAKCFRQIPIDYVLSRSFPSWPSIYADDFGFSSWKNHLVDLIIKRDALGVFSCNCYIFSSLMIFGSCYDYRDLLIRSWNSFPRDKSFSMVFLGRNYRWTKISRYLLTRLLELNPDDDSLWNFFFHHIEKAAEYNRMDFIQMGVEIIPQSLPKKIERYYKILFMTAFRTKTVTLSGLNPEVIGYYSHDILVGMIESGNLAQIKDFRFFSEHQLVEAMNSVAGKCTPTHFNRLARWCEDYYGETSCGPWCGPWCESWCGENCLIKCKEDFKRLSALSPEFIKSDPRQSLGSDSMQIPQTSSGGFLLNCVLRVNIWKNL